MLPVSTCPLVGLSSRKLTVCPAMKFWIWPLSDSGRQLGVDGLRLREGEAMVTAALWALSAPRQLSRAGVTVYRQVPAGTLVSVQLRPDTTPAQVAPIVCAPPPFAYRLTT